MTSRLPDSGRYRRILFDQILSLELCPELGRDSGLHGGVICEDLLLTAGAYNQGCGDIRCCRELKGCRAEIDSMAICNLPKLLAFFKKCRGNLVGRFAVVVTWTSRDNPGVE